ncbi:MAG: TIGR04282 family arsenosugar biosynthesis glycosyltransferase [Bacteroidetes bacterium]|nr:TIGR04282 family arsenosugar biosynthesis glycosyltransferase [Bacteroidota bacterium]
MTGDKALIIIFIKNPVAGKVKTRLAKTIGDEKALSIYNNLLEHTRTVTRKLNCDKIVFYSDFINNADDWDQNHFLKARQEGNDLGERMSNAFNFAFSTGYKKPLIIGSDCPDLNQEHIEKAFQHLNESEVVLGPAKDGGYYLLGMNQFYPELFSNKRWSTEHVMKDTLADISRLNLSVRLLPELTDIDEEKDMEKYNYLLK